MTRNDVCVCSTLMACLFLTVASAWADEPIRGVEARAYAIDSAAGLLATNRGAKFLGTRSCAATACHGSVQPDARYALSRRNEYEYWLDHDPHSRAQFTLDTEASRLILDRLARPGESETDRGRRLANCFACHNPQPSASQQAATFYRSDGVSCESCHGAAEKWIGAHVEPNWRARRQGGSETAQAAIAMLGFVDTEDVAVRGQLCAQCHVGSAGREVNHDLIAAGHPVLKFELAAYHELLPKHWRSEVERQRDPRFEGKLWSAGQIASADAALSLLDWRASTANDKHPDAAWPELAEYDCFACHHDLQDPSWRRQRTIAGLPLGQPAWGSWYFGPLRTMAGATNEPSSPLAELAKQMQYAFGRDREQVTSAAVAMRAEIQRTRQSDSLDDLARRMQLGLTTLTATQEPSAKHGDSQPAGWDEAVQIYLAIVALGSESKKLDEAHLQKVRTLFAFPDKYNSPRGFFGETEPGTLPGQSPPVNAGRPHTRAQVVAALVDLIERLELPETIAPRELLPPPGN